MTGWGVLAGWRSPWVFSVHTSERLIGEPGDWSQSQHADKSFFVVTHFLFFALLPAVRILMLYSSF